MKTQLLLWSLLVSTALQSQVIPDARTVNWGIAGYPGDIPNPSLIIDITELGATGDGVTPADSYISTAIDSLDDSLGVIFFPTGDYLVNVPVVLPGNVILRGAGSDSSKLIFDLGGSPTDAIDVSRAQSAAFTKIITGFEKGSTAITVVDASTFSIGDYAEIRQENGAWNSKPESYADYSAGQFVQIKSINGNWMELENPLRMDYDTSLNLEIRPVDLIQNVGIECMTITRSDLPSSASVYNINFQYAAKCWVAGVESDKSMGSHIMIEQSTQVEVTGCYFHHSFGYDGVGTRGYGVTLRQHAGECLVEDNVFRFLRHAMMVKEGANGNVFAYNYSIEPNRSEPISDLSGDISLHGHYAFANLFEGNIVQNIFIDHARGPSGPYNTIFRNRAELYGISITSDTITTADQNFVGNEIFSFYLLSGNGHFEYGNNVNGTVTPAGTDSLTDSSYYLLSEPEFWETGLNWPSVGIPNSLGSGSIPARERYLSGASLTVCNSSSDGDPCYFIILDTTLCSGQDLKVGSSVYSATGVYNDTLVSSSGCDSLITTYLTIDSTSQEIMINSGWNMISGYIIPYNTDMWDLFSYIEQDIVLVKNNLGQAYIPSFSINVIGDWHYPEGYKVKASNSAVLNIGCEKIDPSTSPISLPAGWSMIAYFRQSPMNAEIALIDISANILLVKNVNGDSYIPAFNINALGDLLPGQGYKIKMSVPDTLYYPADSTQN